MLKIKGRVLGLQKKEVDEYFNNFKKAQEGELMELSEEIEKCQRENAIYRHELSTLTETNASFPDGVLLEQALNRVERVSEFIDQDVDIEVLAIDKITQQKVLVLENTIAEIDKDIEKEKEIIEKELKRIVEIAQGQGRTKNLNIDVIKNIGKLLPIADWLKSNREEQTILGKEFWEEEPTDSTQELIKQMTADGTIHDPLKLDTSSANNTDQNTKRQSSNESQALQKGNPDVDPNFSASKKDFWDVSVGEDNTNLSIQEIAVGEDSDPIGISQDLFQSAETLKVKSTENLNEQSQAGVREEISAVRAKYIIGKVAGEDIMDIAGQLIIRKGDPISVGVMQLAQNEGKLAELIIHMVSPGQDE